MCAHTRSQHAIYSTMHARTNAVFLMSRNVSHSFVQHLNKKASIVQAALVSSSATQISVYWLTPGVEWIYHPTCCTISKRRRSEWSSIIVSHYMRLHHLLHPFQGTPHDGASSPDQPVQVAGVPSINVKTWRPPPAHHHGGCGFKSTVVHPALLSI